MNSTMSKYHSRSRWAHPSWTRSRRLALLLPLLLLALNGCSPARLLNGFVSKEGLVREHALAYGKGARQTLDIYRPAGAKGPLPVVVFFYGGSWQMGRKEDYLFVAERMARQGFVVVIPDYTLYPAAPYPQFLKDGAAAIAWVEKHIERYGGDGEDLHLMGHSAGAYIAVMLGLKTTYLVDAGAHPLNVQSVVGLAGPYDFLPLTDDDIKAVFSSANDLKDTQPINHVGKHLAPMLLLTGLEDEQVKPKNSINLAAALKDQGNEAELGTYPDLGHIGIVLEFAEPLHALRKQNGIAERTAKFFHTYAKAPATKTKP